MTDAEKIAALVKGIDDALRSFDLADESERLNNALAKQMRTHLLLAWNAAPDDFQKAASE